MIRGIIFDFDGVICQTELYRMEFLADQIAELGLSATPKELYPMAGGTRELRNAVFDRLFAEDPGYPAKHDHVMALRYPHEMPFRALRSEGLNETLAVLAEMGLQLAIASNSSLEFLDRALEDCGVSGYFAVIQSGMDSGRRKPDPYIYEQTLRSLGLSRSECLVVEDSPVGIAAGKAACMKVAALRDPFGVLDQSAADHILGSLRELPALIGRL